MKIHLESTISIIVAILTRGPVDVYVVEGLHLLVHPQPHDLCGFFINLIAALEEGGVALGVLLHLAGELVDLVAGHDEDVLLAGPSILKLSVVELTDGSLHAGHGLARGGLGELHLLGRPDELADAQPGREEDLGHLDVGQVDVLPPEPLRQVIDELVALLHVRLGEGGRALVLPLQLLINVSYRAGRGHRLHGEGGAEEEAQDGGALEHPGDLVIAEDLPSKELAAAEGERGLGDLLARGVGAL